MSRGFVPPEYPYDRLVEARKVAAEWEGGIVDLSVGTPGDPPPPAVLRALAGAEDDDDRASRGYPPSAGTSELRRAVQLWTKTRFGVSLPLEAVSACVGTKEFVATTPQWMRLRYPDKDTVLFPAVSYPTYEMGATLAGLRAVPVPMGAGWRMDLTAVDEADVERALLLWVNSPANPTGAVEDLAAAARWARARGIPVFSDECYCEFTWDGAPRTVLGSGAGIHGLEGVVAVHSLSKRSNMAGMRVGWYAGDPDLVSYLREVRKHGGLMVPGPVQRAAVAALGDQDHVERQRSLYLERLSLFQRILTEMGMDCGMPQGGFYHWVRCPDGDDWAWTAWLAERGGALVSPGSFYGRGGAGHVRIAMVVGTDRLELVGERLGVPS